MWNITVHKEGSFLTLPSQSLFRWNFDEKLGEVFTKEHQSIAVLNQSFLFILLVLTMIFFFLLTQMDPSSVPLLAWHFVAVHNYVNPMLAFCRGDVVHFLLVSPNMMLHLC